MRVYKCFCDNEIDITGDNHVWTLTPQATIKKLETTLDEPKGLSHFLETYNSYKEPAKETIICPFCKGISIHELCDDPELLNKYEIYDTNKYDGKIVREAMRQIEAEQKQKSRSEKEEVADMYDRLKDIPGFDENTDRDQAKQMAGDIYAVSMYDCRNYADDVIKRGHEIAKKQGKKFILE